MLYLLVPDWLNYFKDAENYTTLKFASIITEACREYCLPPVPTFADYEMAFESVESNAIFSALIDQEADSSYVEHQLTATLDARLFSSAVVRPSTIRIGEGMRHGVAGALQRCSG